MLQIIGRQPRPMEKAIYVYACDTFDESFLSDDRLRCKLRRSVPFAVRITMESAVTSAFGKESIGYGSDVSSEAGLGYEASH